MSVDKVMLIKQKLEYLCHQEFKIGSYPSYIYIPPLSLQENTTPLQTHQAEKKLKDLQFFEFVYDIKPYIAHFRVMKQFAIDSNPLIYRQLSESMSPL
mmetsp:Transcript_4834/g.8293  ORF Transcript_4834/g.8293 Transcript_4834/m.8293 type:complete len:98 (+) Transcript_4834:414-707(+)